MRALLLFSLSLASPLLLFREFYCAVLYVLIKFHARLEDVIKYQVQMRCKAYTLNTLGQKCVSQTIWKSECVAAHGERNGKCAVLKNTKAKVSKPHTVFSASCECGVSLETCKTDSIWIYVHISDELFHFSCEQFFCSSCKLAPRIFLVVIAAAAQNYTIPRYTAQLFASLFRFSLVSYVRSGLHVHKHIPVHMHGSSDVVFRGGYCVCALWMCTYDFIFHLYTICLYY